MFEKILTKYAIEVNSGDKFKGEKIILFYDPGLFPMYLKVNIFFHILVYLGKLRVFTYSQNQETGKLKEVNGGIPQRGNVTEHLNEFIKVVTQVPPDFNGML